MSCVTVKESLLIKAIGAKPMSKFAALHLQKRYLDMIEILSKGRQIINFQSTNQ
jgi:hypothetical protein